MTRRRGGGGKGSGATSGPEEHQLHFVPKGAATSSKRLQVIFLTQTSKLRRFDIDLMSSGALDRTNQSPLREKGAELKHIQSRQRNDT